MISGVSTWNYLERRLGRGSTTILSADNIRIRISVTDGVIIVLSGPAYPATLIGKTIEVWGAGGAGTLIDESDGYEFDPATGVISDIADGVYLVLFFTA